MKKLVIAFILALVAILAFGSTVSAWEYEDPCVVDSEDFVVGWGFDGWGFDGVYETKGGAQVWPYPQLPNEGYSLYRDDVTDTGNLDTATVFTFTPDVVDLPIIAEYHDSPTLAYWYMETKSPNTFYWALEPRGYNDLPNPNPTYIKIVLPDASTNVQYYGKAVCAIDFNDGTWRIQMPRGTWILNSDGSMAGSLVVDSNGNIVSDVRFVYHRDGEVTVTRWGP